jgi:pimeloyl-ACP methyl ester carboxylesterase
LEKDLPKKLNASTNRRNFMRLATGVIGVLCGLAVICAPLQAQQHDRDSISKRQETPKSSYFFVGGTYAGDPKKQVMHGQMFVEKLAPERPRRRYPIILIHGAAQTSTNWMGTPDGREGWAEFLTSQGYVVYMVDQPARGRSAWQQGIDGPLRTVDAQTIEKMISVPEAYNIWTQAKLHTQWPGSGPRRGRTGDPIFDQFYASQVQSLASNAETESLVKDAVSALLDRIGPAIVLTHSQSGPAGWLIADARPTLVKAIIAVEPSGPPFQDAVLDDSKARPWGITDVPITYEPPITDPAELKAERQTMPESADLVPCWQQSGPVHALKNLRDIPVMVLTAEASWHAVYDHCTARYLTQAGVKTDFVRLGAIGIHGNGHMMMLEKNNLRVAEVIVSWLEKKARSK